MVKSLSEWTKSLNLQGSFSREKVFAVNSCVAQVRNKSSDSSMSSSSSPSMQNDTTTSSSTSILPSSRISRHVSVICCYQLLSSSEALLSICSNLSRSFLTLLFVIRFTPSPHEHERYIYVLFITRKYKVLTPFVSEKNNELDSRIHTLLRLVTRLSIHIECGQM